MKIKSLQIHNVAAFSEATIDFEHPALARTNVFLISGEVGSGKTTILDAISLALYGRTPRFSNESKRGTRGTDNKFEDKLLDSSDHLIRRGCKSAWVILEFEANGDRYEVRWDAPGPKIRARKLRNISTGAEVTTAEEVDAEIKRLSGVDYEQFARTTMLPQGQFANFLKCADNEKAATLERILGVDIYARIGAAIYRRKADSDLELASAKAAMESMNMLTITQRRQFAREIKQMGKVRVVRQNELTEIINNTAWLKQLPRLITSAGDSARLLEEINMAVEDNDWEAQIKLDTGGEILQNRREIIDCLSSVSEPLRRMEKARERVEKERNILAEINTLIADQQSYIQLYDSYDTISDSNTRFQALRKQIDEEARNLAVLIKQTDEKLQPALDKALAARDSAAKAHNNTREEYDNAVGELKKYDLPALSNAWQLAVTDLNTIKEIRTEISNYYKNEETRSRLEREIDKEKLVVSNLVAQAAEQEKIKIIEEAKLSGQQHLRDIQHAAASKTAATIRDILRPGDCCPVCGHEIKDCPDTHTDLSIALAQADKVLEQQKLAVLEATKSLGLTMGKLSQARKAVVSKEEQLKKLIEGLKSQLPAIITKCCDAQVQVSAEAELPDEEELANVQTERERGVEKAKAFLDGANSCQKQVNYLREKLNLAIRTLEMCREKVNAVVEKINAQKIEETAIMTRQETARREFDTQRKKLLSVPGALLGWREDISSREINTEVEKLRERKEAYVAMCKNSDDIAKTLQTLEQQLTSATESQKRIRNVCDRMGLAFPSSAQDAPLDSTESFDIELVNLASRLEKLDISRVNIATALLGTARGHAQACALSLDTHIKECPEIFSKLDTTNLQALQTEIEKIDNQQNTVREELSAIESILGSKSEQLKADTEKRPEFERRKRAVDEAKAKNNQLKQLNDLFGDKDGNKMRRIALSYVLDSLVQTANKYLQILTQRYVLAVKPGSFIILVKDAFQGDIARPVNTISGGETFMVSLSLALALSNVGNISGIDCIFIDEGFGSLSGNELQGALALLSHLPEKMQRRVGIISHLPELVEQIPVSISIRRGGPGIPSTLEIVG